MGWVQEFKEFAMKGNVIDLAVGVVIGTAFGKIVSSLVSDIIMPPLNLLTAKSGVNFKDAALRWQVDLPKMQDGKPVVDAAGTPVMEATNYSLFNYGAFIQTIIDFLIVAFAIFMFIKLMNEARRRFEKEKAAAPPPEPSEEVKLLREIRDQLAKR
jgi:large conductance mechanosensitive channel